MKDEIIYGHLNWSTDKDVQAYLSNRPAVLCFQGIGAERSGLKTDGLERVWISPVMVLVMEMNESESSLKCRK